MVMVSFKGSFVFACFILMVMVSFKGSFCLFYLDGYGVVQGIFCFLLVLSWWLWCRSRDLLLFYLDGYGVVKGSFVFCLFYLDGYGVVQGIFCFCLFYLDSYGVVQGIFCFLFVLSWWLWCRSRDLLFFACFTLMVMVSFKGSFVFCLFYLYSYGVVQGIFCFLLVLPCIVMVSFKGSFVFCLFYLDGYGVVQGIFCFLLFYLDGYGVVQGIFCLWCRSRDLLFLLVLLMVMVSFKGSFVFCLFYLDGYGVVQGIFCFLLVLSWWLWCRSRDLLLFDCFIFMVMVSFKGSFVVCLFYLDGYGVVQGIFCCLLVLPWWLWCRSRDLLFLLVLSWWLWCRSRDLLFFACFILMVMVSLFYLDGYGVVHGIFCCLLVLPLWLWCRSRDLLFFACFILMFYLYVMVSFKGSFVVCLFYLYGYGVVQGIFCCLFVLSLWLWCRSRDLLLFACFTLMVMVSFKGSFVVCLFYLYGYGVVIFCCLFVLSL